MLGSVEGGRGRRCLRPPHAGLQQPAPAGGAGSSSLLHARGPHPLPTPRPAQVAYPAEQAGLVHGLRATTSGLLLTFWGYNHTLPRLIEARRGGVTEREGAEGEGRGMGMTVPMACSGAGGLGCDAPRTCEFLLEGPFPSPHLNPLPPPRPRRRR